MRRSNLVFGFLVLGLVGFSLAVRAEENHCDGIAGGKKILAFPAGGRAGRDEELRRARELARAAAQEQAAEDARQRAEEEREAHKQALIEAMRNSPESAEWRENREALLQLQKAIAAPDFTKLTRNDVNLQLHLIQFAIKADSDFNPTNVSPTLRDQVRLIAHATLELMVKNHYREALRANGFSTELDPSIPLLTPIPRNLRFMIEHLTANTPHGFDLWEKTEQLKHIREYLWNETEMPPIGFDLEPLNRLLDAIDAQLRLQTPTYMEVYSAEIRSLRNIEEVLRRGRTRIRSVK